MRRVRALVPFALALVVLGLAGCGVTATNQPVDQGDAAVGGSPAGDNDRLDPPEPDQAFSADDLVRNFLQASAGGLAPANERVKRYLTGAALANWKDPVDVENPQLSVVRIVRGPEIGAADRTRGTPVTVVYEPVGVLNGHGRVDELASPEVKQLIFWVVQAEEQFNLRIGEIEGWPPEAQLLLSDQGLMDFYLLQPIYFWDRDYTTLVPDLRWVPRTINPDQRASRRLSWLATGPAPWLGSSVQTLPTGTNADNVVSDDGRLQVKLSSAAVAPGDAAAARRLMIQLKWSLADDETWPQIDLHIQDQPTPVDVGENELRNSLFTSSYQGPAGQYDITAEGVVVPIAPTPAPAMLSVPQNTGVEWAAVSRDPAAAMFVAEDNSLLVVADGQARPVDLPLSGGASLGRPSFVPRTHVALVPTGGPDGRLLAVSVESGAVSDAAGSRLTGVSAAVVSPDGRRIALIAEGDLYVAPLNVIGGTVTVGSGARQLLAGQVTATTVTWTTDSWLLVAGTRDEQPRLWRVTADGVVARDLSEFLRGLRVDDLVCWPNWRNSRFDTEVRAVTNQGVYTFRSQFSLEGDLNAPFFG